jgi:hypothetical protein
VNDDDIHPDFNCDRCGVRTPDRKGHYLFAERICDDCAIIPNDD